MDAETNPPLTSRRERLARRLLSMERLLMGLVFLSCGVAGLLGSTPHDASAAADSLLKIGVLFPLLKGTEVLLELYLASIGRRP